MSTYLITGANRGIGLALTQQAAASGASVIATAREPARATDLAAVAKASAGRVEIVAMDVADDSSIVSARAAIGDRPIHTLINNAGVISKPQTVLDMEAEDFLSVVRVNVLGPVAVTRAFLPNLRAAGEARVAVISSMMGSFGYGSANRIAYSTSKTAVNRLFHALAGELAPDGVHVAILSPGWVRTDMGGAGATLSADESAAGLLRAIAATDASKSGAFRNYAGQAMTW